MEKSYSIIYQGDIIKALEENGINRYMILNGQLAVIYVDENFDENTLESISEITWVQEAQPMSSLIQIQDGVENGETVTDASGTDYIENSPYLSIGGEGVIIAIIDSGIDYMHPDFINEDNTSKIISIWDQDGNTNPPPEGMIFGSEYTRQDINNAISNNDSSLTKDDIGTGTIAAGIASGGGALNPLYKGVAPKSELVVVKLKSYEGTYENGKINYLNTDFLAAIKYVLDISKRENKNTIINLTIAERSRSFILTNLLDTFPYLNSSGVILVSGAGNEGNTNIHYEGTFSDDSSEPIDITLEVGEQNSLDITICPNGPGRLGVEIISPTGEVSYNVQYSPDEEVYKGKFNLENSPYLIKLTYPWILSGNEEIYIKIFNIRPGIGTIRVFPEFFAKGEFDLYLPNGNLIPNNTRFLDPNSYSTITLYGATENVITVGAFNDKTNGMWIGSSKGPMKSNIVIKPDIVAPGVDIISPFINSTYIKSTGTGVSSSLTSGVLALIMEYISTLGTYQRKLLFTKVLKTYLMLGATKNPIYTYPNSSQGYGVLNLRDTIVAIANNI